MQHPAVSKQDYEARVRTEIDRLLNVRKDWRTVVKTMRRLRDDQKIHRDVYQAVEDAARKAMEPVQRHLAALQGMDNDMNVVRRQPNFSRMDDPQALVFTSTGLRNEAGWVEHSDRFDLM